MPVMRFGKIPSAENYAAGRCKTVESMTDAMAGRPVCCFIDVGALVAGRIVAYAGGILWRAPSADRAFTLSGFAAKRHDASPAGSAAHPCAAPDWWCPTHTHDPQGAVGSLRVASRVYFRPALLPAWLSGHHSVFKLCGCPGDRTFLGRNPVDGARHACTT